MSDKNNETDTTLQEEALEIDEISQPEEWQGELPPEDDFHDQDEALGDDLPDESLGEEASEDAVDEAALQAERAKRGKTMLFGILVVGVVLIGGLAYLQFGSSSGGGGGPIPVTSVMPVNEIRDAALSTQGMRKVTPPDPLKKTEKVDLEKMQEEALGAGKNAVPNGDSLDLIAEKPMSGSQSTDILTSSSESPVAPAPIAPPPAPPVQQTAAKATMPAMSDEMEKIAKEVASMSVSHVNADALKPVPVALGTPVQSSAAPAPVAAPAPMPAAPAAASNADARLKEMEAQIESLKKSLDNATAQNTTLLARIETMQQQQKKKAEKQQEQLDAIQPVVIDKKSEPVKEVKKETSSQDLNTLLDPTMVEASQPAPKAKAEVKAATPRKAKVASKPATAKKSKAASSADQGAQWVLRAATPDAAWVSISRDSMELRRVAIGEALPGLGKVKEIRQSGQTWEVVGETGVLK